MQITQDLLQAVDIVVTERLNGLAFDTTEICTIIGLEDSFLNTYRVRFNNVTFVAQALNGETYESDNRVTVTIPKGDLNAPGKTINGKVDSSATKEKVWENPLDRMIDYVQITDIEDLRFVNNTNEDVTLISTTVNMDPNIWQQFIEVSSLGLFDFIGFKADIYSYLGKDISVPDLNTRYWLEVQLCNSVGMPLHTLVKDALSSILFTSEDIDGDPYNQALEDQTYYKLWHFPKDEIVDINQITQLKITLGVPKDVILGLEAEDVIYDSALNCYCEQEVFLEGEPDEYTLATPIGIFFTNMQLTFGYDLNDYIDEGIILAIPQSEQDLQSGYTASSTPPNISAWIMREDKTGLMQDSDFIKTEYYSNLYNDFLDNDASNGFYSIIPRYADYYIENTSHNQLNWFLDIPQGNNNPIDYELSDKFDIIQIDLDEDDNPVFGIASLSDTENKNSFISRLQVLLAEENNKYHFTTDISDAINSDFASMEQYVSKLLKHYYTEDGSTPLKELTNNEIKSTIVGFFTAYESLINTVANAVDTNYELRWYTYKFGIDEATADNIGGTNWLPIGTTLNATLKDANFEYYLSTKLLKDVYRFSVDAETKIKACLCKESFRTTTQAAEGEIQYNYRTTTKNVQLLESEILTFSNSTFTTNDLVKNDYLAIKGENFQNIYTYNNTLKAGTSNCTLVVDFVDQQAIPNMQLVDGETDVIWELLSPDVNTNQIQKLQHQEGSILDFQSIKQAWYDCLNPSGTEDEDIVDFGKYSSLAEYARDAAQRLVERVNWEYESRLDSLDTVITEYTEQLINQILTEDNKKALLKSDIGYFQDQLAACANYRNEAVINSSSKRYKSNVYKSDVKDFFRTRIENAWTKLSQYEEAYDYKVITKYNKSQKSLWDNVSYTPQSIFHGLQGGNTSTIRCTIGNFYADFTINFTLMGTQGTDYVFIITPVDSTSLGVKHVVGSTAQYKAVLRSAKDGTEITIPEDKIRWSWKQGDRYKCCFQGTSTTAAITSINKISYSKEEKLSNGDIAYKNSSGATLYTIRNYFSLTPSRSALQECLATIKLNRLFSYSFELEGTNGYLYNANDGGEKKLTFRAGRIPNMYVLQAECDITIEYDEHNSYTENRTRTLTAQYPIAVYHNDVKSVTGPYEWVWNDQNRLIYPEILQVDPPLPGTTSTVVPLDGAYNIQLKTARKFICEATTDNIARASDTAFIDDLIKNANYYPQTEAEAGQGPKQYRTEMDSHMWLVNYNSYGYVSDLITLVYVEWGTNIILYERPLITSIGTYSVDAANVWSGKGVYQDNTKGVILTSQVGAGELNSKGEFTGVIMGTVAKNQSSDIEKGIFGYKDGQEFFKASTKGEFIFKKDNDNLIQFINGSFTVKAKEFKFGNTDYYIQSSAADGCEIKSKSFTFTSNDGQKELSLTSSGLTIVGKTFSYDNGDSTNFFKINNSDGIMMKGKSFSFTNSAGDQYISLNSSDGCAIAAKKISITTTNFILNSNPANNTSYYIDIKKGTSSIFSINKKGDVYLKGQVEATSGLIGNWGLSGGVLSATNTTTTGTYTTTLSPTNGISSSGTITRSGNKVVSSTRAEAEHQISFEWKTASNISVYAPYLEEPAFGKVSKIFGLRLSSTGAIPSKNYTDLTSHLDIFADATYNIGGIHFTPESETIGRLMIIAGTAAESTEAMMTEVLIVAGNYDEQISSYNYRSTLYLGRDAGASKGSFAQLIARKVRLWAHSASEIEFQWSGGSCTLQSILDAL